ncbi:GntR family transcriptional regulator [Glaciibacter superstes]|uniref:GntR family transcriptional regulator n=1 Tax=Glaciibacter superstes TaxID=501023 RepID=UPI0003B77032|nr:GntR family transcriptional regulator [Glaciibacter superstes]
MSRNAALEEGDNAPAKPTKRDRIVNELRRMIRDGEITRGMRIRQDVLAEMFKTSITPVREALRLLEAEGLLTGEPHRGVRVADADIESVKSIYLQRRLLESYAMKRAVRRVSPRDLDTAERLLEKMERLHETGEDQLVPGLNHEFHYLFYSLCGNEGLLGQIETLWQQWPWDILRVSKVRASAAPGEHRSLLAAARAGDVDEIARLTEQHLARSYMALAEHLIGETVDDPFDIDVD